MKSVDLIEVHAWGRLVGAVAPDPGLGAYVFEYSPQWRRSGVELAPIMMPVTGRRATYAFPSLHKDAFNGLPGMLADALPDDFGNQLIDAWMARRGIAKQQVTMLDRMAYMGSRGMGAIEFRPARGSHSESAEPLEMKVLVEEARKTLAGDFSGDREAQAALANIIRVGTSAGGARAKAVIAWNPDTREMRSGQFDVAPGFEHWLLKFDGVGRDLELGQSQSYGRIEYAYSLMAKAAGLDMSPCRLLEENGRAHFMTRRFDREGNRKIHMQSLCALQHMSYKQRGTHAYESLFLTAARLGLGVEAMTELFARMVFNVAARNNDDHSKNFSFLMREGGHWELAPAYDVTHAYNPGGDWTYQHLMGVNGKFDGITRPDLMRVRDQFSIPGSSEVFEQVNDAVAHWSEFADEAGLSAVDRDGVARDFVAL